MPDGVAPRRIVVVAAMGWVLDARSQHDLPARDGRQRSLRAAAGSLG